MKKLSLICITILLGMGLSACENDSNSHSTKSSTSSSKVVKHKDKSKNKHKNTNLKETSSSTVQSQGNITSSTQTTSVQSSENDDWTEVDAELNKPYKGYATYRDYLNAHGGDPDVQRQTDQMQTQYEIQQGYANPDGTVTPKGQSIIDEFNNGEYGGN